jgi:hypothetical protein
MPSNLIGCGNGRTVTAPRRTDGAGRDDVCRRAMTEINPTLTEFAELVAEEKAALLAGVDVEDDTSEAVLASARLHKARAAILAARPSDRKVMAMQMQWWLKERQEPLSRRPRHVGAHRRTARGHRTSRRLIGAR